MRKVSRIFAATLFLAAVSTASQATDDFLWSFRDVDQGGTNTILGTLSLPDSCFASCTNVAATSVLVTSSPFGPLGFNFASAHFFISNSFSTLAGVITSAQFDMWDIVGSGIELALSLPGSQFPGQFFGNGPQVASDGWIYSGGNGTGDSLTFTAAIPEPEIYAMMLTGLGVLGFVARRKKRQAADA
jgi:PEP-CTERM motif